MDFLVAGAQKSGTTALHRYLEAHPQVVMGTEKELHHFDDEELFGSDEAATWNVYEARFPRRASDPDTVVGEVTPIYLYWPSCPARIAAYNPGMKVIVLLRDPRDRAWSQYHMEISRSFEDLPFVEAVAKELARVAHDGSSDRVRSYLTRGLYAQQLQRLWDHIPRQQTLVLRHERLLEEAPSVVAEICAFLGVTDHPGFREEEVFVGDYPVMPVEIRRALTRFFEEEVDRLESITGWDLAAWRS